MNKPFSHSLSYMELYQISEELCQLKGSFLQEVICEGAERYFLKFYSSKSLSRWVVFDLTPHQPFILSVTSTLIRKQKKPTPVLNFLKAHFKGLILRSIEIAAKPNRTLKFNFDEAEIIFKCFPHGQALGLFKEGKKVIYPPQPEEKVRELLSFVEPEEIKSWQHNDLLALKLNLDEPRENKNKTVDPLMKQILKTEKTLEKMQSQRGKFIEETAAKIEDLEKSALKIKQDPNLKGAKLNETYLEIKKLKRRLLEYGEKQNEVKKRISFLKTVDPELLPINPKEDSKTPRFSGTRIIIDSKFQFWVGRKAAQNDELLKMSLPHELWFHMRDYSSAHGILKGPKNLAPTAAQIEFCCQIIAQLSQSQKKAFKEGEKFDFIITPKKFVKKKKGMAAGAVIVERETIRRIAFKIVKFNVI